MAYEINYNDKRFQDVEQQKQTAINESNNLYNNMIGQSDKYYQDQINAAKDYAEQQKNIQQQNTQFAIEQVNQQKDQAKKNYIKEQQGAYVDWQKQSNQYGANAEQMAASGIMGGGYSESSQVSMFNTYQNRVATSRESYNQAVLNYDNAIKDAMLKNNAALAEIAFKALQTQLELSLQGFQYKNNLILEQANKKQELENTYYNRWQDVLNQINQENTLAEEQRQYNENLALQKAQLAEEQRQFNASLSASYSSGGSSGGGSYPYIDLKDDYVTNSLYWNGKRAENVGNYGYFNNGYQPKGVQINGKAYKLESTGIKFLKTNTTLNGSKETKAITIWKAGGKYFYWNGPTNSYVEMSKKEYKKHKNSAK